MKKFAILVALIIFIIVGISIFHISGLIPAELTGILEEDTEDRVGIESVNHSIVDIDPYNNNAQVDVTVNLNEPVNESRLEIHSDTIEMDEKILSHSDKSKLEDNTTIHTSSNHEKVSFRYKIEKDNDIKKDHRFFGRKYVFSTWPEISIKYRIGSEEYEAVYNRSLVNYRVNNITETKLRLTGDPTYKDAIIVSDGRGFVVVNNRSGDAGEEVRTEHYNIGNVNYTVIGTTNDKQINYSKVFSNSKLLFDEKDISYSNTIFVLDESDAYYAGGAIDKEKDHTVLWIEDNYVSDIVHTTLGHEIVHSSQTYYMSDRMEWWIEGSAEYLGAIIEKHSFSDIDEEYLSEREFSDSEWSYTRRDKENQNSKLSNESSWVDSFNYKQGMRLVYIIDRNIRESTENNKSVFQLHQWMQDENNVDYEDFKSKVRDLTSRKFSDRLDSYLQQSRPINVNYSDLD